MKKKLAICSSHVIQYKVPVFRELSVQDNVDLKVYYYSDTGVVNQKNDYHGNIPRWDLPLLSGYSYEFLKNWLNIEKWHNNWFGPYFNPSIIKKIRREKYDAIMIHSYQYFSDWLTLLTAKTIGSKVIFYGEMYPRNNFSLARNITRKIFHHNMLSNCDAYLAIGSVAEKTYQNEYGIKRSKIFLAPYSVDNEFFIENYNKNIINRNDLRNSLGISDEEVVILCVAGMVPKKNHKRIIDAVRQLSLPVRLVLVGDGPLLLEIKEYCYKNLPKTILPGFINQSEISKYYSLSDIFVIASFWEEFGLVINEAMCSNLPIIASKNVAATADLVKEDVNGWVFDPEETGILAMMLEELCKNQEKRINFGKKSGEVISTWNVNRTVQGIIEAVDFVCG